MSFIDENTIVFWDIDNTIIQTSDLGGSEEWFVYCFNKLVKKHSADIALAKTLDIQAMLWQKALFKTVENTTSSVVAYSQTKAKRVFALTARGMINCYSTIHVLNSLNMNFNQISFPKEETLILADVYKSHGYKAGLTVGSQAGYAHGIIFCGGHDAGDTVKKISEYINISTEKIMVIDDKKEKINEVAMYCKNHNIKFIGCHYTAGSQSQSNFQKYITKIDHARKNFLKTFN